MGGDDIPLWLRGSNRLIRGVVHVKRRRSTPPPSPTEVLGARSVSLDADGRAVSAWWAPAGDGHAPAVLLVHGFGGGAGHLLAVAAGVRELGAHALIVDDAVLPGPPRRGARLAPPRPHAVAEAGLAWLRGRTDVGAVALIGHSMGGATVLGVAAVAPDVSAVVTFGAIGDPGATRMAGIPAGLNRRALEVLERRTGVDMRGSMGAGAIHRVTAPVLVAHGGADRTVPPFNADVLVAAGPTARRLLVAGVAHRPADVYAAARPEVDAFLRLHLGL